MDTECIGKAVSLDCGALGFYQGVIDSFELEEQTLTIINPVQNGRKVDRPRLTLRLVSTLISTWHRCWAYRAQNGRYIGTRKIGSTA